MLTNHTVAIISQHTHVIIILHTLNFHVLHVASISINLGLQTDSGGKWLQWVHVRLTRFSVVFQVVFLTCVYS